MKRYGQKIRWAFILIILCMALYALSGCAMVGPSSISMGRADYNEAINKTEDEQMLLSLVKGRYGETFSLLSVTGVAANVRFGSRAGADIGFGPTNNYAGNLVPFSAGLAYEENPTITYAPVQGEHYLRQVMSPIPLDILLLTVRSMTSGAQLFTLLVNRINELQNPDFLDGPSAEPDPRFARYVELMVELQKAGVLDLLEAPRKDIAFDVVIDGNAPQYSKKIYEFLDLLDLQRPEDGTGDIVIPAFLAVRTKKMWGIAITTRSTMDLIEILRAAIEVPEEHDGAGLVIHYPPMGLPGQGIRINSSTEKPNDMSLAVKYRGYWFTIGEADQRTKAFFRTVRAFWSVSMAASTDQRAAPVLTIPVSR